MWEFGKHILTSFQIQKTVYKELRKWCKKYKDLIAKFEMTRNPSLFKAFITKTSNNKLNNVKRLSELNKKRVNKSQFAQIWKLVSKCLLWYHKCSAMKHQQKIISCPDWNQVHNKKYILTFKILWIPTLNLCPFSQFANNTAIYTM